MDADSSVLAMQGDRGVAEDGEVLECVAGAGAVVVLVAGDVADQMELSLDAPVPADECRQVFGLAASAGRLVR